MNNGYTCIQIWRWSDVETFTKEFIEQTVDEVKTANPLWVISVEETLHDSPVVNRILEAVARREYSDMYWDIRVKSINSFTDDWLYIVFEKPIRGKIS